MSLTQNVMKTYPNVSYASSKIPTKTIETRLLKRLPQNSPYSQHGYTKTSDNRIQCHFRGFSQSKQF